MSKDLKQTCGLKNLDFRVLLVIRVFLLCSDDY